MSTTTASVWNTFSQQLRAFLSTRVYSPADADDLLQEVFIKVHQKLHQLTDTDNLGPWLYRVTRNQLMDYYRKHKRTPEQPLALEEAEGNEDYHDLLECVAAIVAELPESYREPLLLADHQGMKQQAIADRLELSLSATKSRIQRGRSMVREHLHSCCKISLAESGVLTGAYGRSSCSDCD